MLALTPRQVSRKCWISTGPWASWMPILNNCFLPLRVFSWCNFSLAGSTLLAHSSCLHNNSSDFQLSSWALAAAFPPSQIFLLGSSGNLSYPYVSLWLLVVAIFSHQMSWFNRFCLWHLLNSKPLGFFSVQDTSHARDKIVTVKFGSVRQKLALAYLPNELF